MKQLIHENEKNSVVLTLVNDDFHPFCLKTTINGETARKGFCEKDRAIEVYNSMVDFIGHHH